MLRHCAALTAALTLASGLAQAASHLTLYPAPPDEPASADYQVTANGQPVFCYTSYRFDLDSTVTIAGRPVSPTTFAYLDADGPDSPITGVTFDEVVINGERLVPGDRRLKTNAWVSGVVVK